MFCRVSNCIAKVPPALRLLLERYSRVFPPLLRLVNVRVKVDRKLISSLCFVVDVYRHGNARAVESSPSLIVNRHLGWLPTKHITPNLSLMHLSHKHSPLSRSRVAHDYRTPVRLVPSTAAHPTHTIGFFKVVILFAIGIEFACERQVSKFVSASSWFRMGPLRAVEVAVEKAWIAIDAEEDEGVG